MATCPECNAFIGAYSSMDAWYIGAPLGIPPDGFGGESSKPTPTPTHGKCPNCNVGIKICKECGGFTQVKTPKDTGGNGVLGMGRISNNFKKGAHALSKQASTAMRAAETALAKVPSEVKSAAGFIAGAGAAAAMVLNPANA